MDTNLTFYQFSKLHFSHKFNELSSVLLSLFYLLPFLFYSFVNVLWCSRALSITLTFKGTVRLCHLFPQIYLLNTLYTVKCIFIKFLGNLQEIKQRNSTMINVYKYINPLYVKSINLLPKLWSLLVKKNIMKRCLKVSN